ncbi:hypothetical protein WJX73_005528 [Symbiochloris irregularis]|uniref:Protein transport protein SEC23 n=1 Tax=Symbiochloris irregularis TaxID=706552 RepID=A0AAW1NNF1_9CHLO
MRPEKAAGRNARERRRCTGAAMDAALHLLNAFPPLDSKSHGHALSSSRGHHMAASPSPRGQESASRGPQTQDMSRSVLPRFSHMLVFVTGPCTEGPGSVPLNALDGKPRPRDSHAQSSAAKCFSQMAASASDLSTAVDVLALGCLAVNAPMLSRVCDTTGGAFMIHEELTAHAGKSLAASLQRRVGLNGVLDIHCSPGLEVTRITGPCVAVNRGPKGALMRMRGSGWSGRLGSHAQEVRSICRGQTFAITLDVTKPLQGQYAFVQVICGWTTREGTQVQRVMTKRLRLTDSVSTHLRAVDVPCAALLLAKGIVGRGRELRAASDGAVRASLRQALAKHIRHVAEQTGQKLPGSRRWFGGGQKQTWKLPAGLQYFAEALFQLQRGPMLGASITHEDTRAFLASTFIGVPLDCGLAMLAPVLYLWNGEGRQFERVFPSDMALRPDSVAVLDCGTQLFIWLGHQTANAARVPCFRGTDSSTEDRQCKADLLEC